MKRHPYRRKRRWSGESRGPTSTGSLSTPRAARPWLPSSPECGDGASSVILYRPGGDYRNLVSIGTDDSACVLKLLDTGGTRCVEVGERSEEQGRSHARVHHRPEKRDADGDNEGDGYHHGTQTAPASRRRRRSRTTTGHGPPANTGRRRRCLTGMRPPGTGTPRIT